jgi:hypothetical protein
MSGRPSSAVLADTVPEQMWGITTSQATLAGILGARAAPTVYRRALDERADTVARASRIYPAEALRCQ